MSDLRPGPSPERNRTIAAIVLVGLGLVFLLVEIFNIRVGHIFWPMLILIPGIAILVAAFGSGRANPALAIPGAVITVTGLIFLYQSSTGHWESWAYIWALYPVGVGLSLMAVGSRTGDPGMVEAGQQAARWGAIAFLIGAVFFELLIFDRGGVSGYILPIALILIGGAMLFMQSRRGEGFRFDRFGRPGPIVTPPPAPPAPAPATETPRHFTAPPPAGPASRPAADPPPASAGSASRYPLPGSPPSGAPVPPAPSTDTPFPADEIPEPPADSANPSFPEDDQSTEPPAATRRPRNPSPGTRPRTQRPRTAASEPEDGSS